MQCKRHFRYASASFGEGIAHRSSRAGKSRNSGETTFAEGEHRDDTATPAKPSLTGGAGLHTNLSSDEASEQAVISSLDEIYLTISSFSCIILKNTL